MKKLFGEKSKPRTFLNALVVFVLIFAFFICILLTACDNKIDKDKTNKTPTQNEQTGGNQGGQENQGSQTGENQGSQENQGNQTGGETGGNQGGETGGETGGEETPNPEKTPAEYKAECEQKIVDALKTAMTGGRSDISAEIKDYKFNIQNGDLYSHSAIYRNGELRGNYFYKYTSNLNSIQNLSYKQISERLDNITLTNVEKVTNLKLSITSDKYNALCNYVLSQCDLQGSEILNVTEFADGAGFEESITTVLYNGEIFTISAKTTAPTTDNSIVIDCLLGDNGLTKSVTITSHSAFKDFDNIVSAEAGISSYQVKLA